MDPDLLTQLVRAGNDGVIPAPLAGEDMRAYKFRAACAGAVVAAQWMEKTMADKAERQAQEREDADETRSSFNGSGEEVVPVTSPGRPSDVTTTSRVPGLTRSRTAEEIDTILRRPHLNGAGTPHYGEDVYDEIGVD